MSFFFLNSGILFPSKISRWQILGVQSHRVSLESLPLQNIQSQLKSLLLWRMSAAELN